MKNKLAKRLFMMISILSLAISGCTFKPTLKQQEPITIALTQDILSFDPIKTSDIFSEALHRCLYTSLYDFDEQLKRRPKLAKSEKVIDDTTWQIEIHDNVLFHDGSKLSVDDVIFSIERAMVGERTQKLLEVIDSVEKIDDTNFIIKSTQPYSDLLSLFAKAETSIVSKKTVEDPNYDFLQPNGAGPFKLLKRIENSKISLARFDDYYLDVAASTYLDFVVIVTEQERTTSFLSGDVDILFSVSPYDCERLRVSQNVKLLQSQSSKIEYLSLNNLHAPLNNPTVRLAISYAINRDVIADNVYHSYSSPSSSLIPEGVIGYTPSLITYDPTYAKQLLSEAGYADGFAFNVITIDTIRKNTLEYIKLDLASIGITLNYNLVTMKEAVDLMMANKHDAILVGWAFNSDPNTVLPLLLGSGSGKTMNSSNYSNPLVDALIIEARQESDYQKKEQIYQKINTIVTKDAPIVVLQNPMILGATQASIEGVTINHQGLIDYQKIYRK